MYVPSIAAQSGQKKDPSSGNENKQQARGAEKCKQSNIQLITWAHCPSKQPTYDLLDFLSRPIFFPKMRFWHCLLV